MTRWAYAGLAALLAGSTGCLDEHVSRSGPDNVPVPTPDVPAASVAAAARVDQIGRELVSASPFLGVDPTFLTIGVPEPILLHPDQHGVMVSEGLVKKCTTDGQLAAVLATELGRMVAEKKTAARFKRPEPPPPLPTLAGDNNQFEGVSSDMNQLAERAAFEKRYGQPTERAERAEDARETAAEVLRAAGYPESDLDAVAPLLKQAAANKKLAPTFVPKSAPPRWSP